MPRYDGIVQVFLFQFLFVLKTKKKKKKRLSQDTILFWIRLIIAHAHESANVEGCRAVRVKAHKAQEIGRVLLLCSRRTLQ